MCVCVCVCVWGGGGEWGGEQPVFTVVLMVLEHSVETSAGYFPRFMSVTDNLFIYAAANREATMALKNLQAGYLSVMSV